MNYRENRVHSSKVKPFSYYQCLIPDEFAYAPMHWHSEFEINFVREGFAEFNCGDEKFVSSAGDIIVIQPNVMHSVPMHTRSMTRWCSATRSSGARKRTAISTSALSR